MSAHRSACAIVVLLTACGDTSPGESAGEATSNGTSGAHEASGSGDTGGSTSTATATGDVDAGSSAGEASDTADTGTAETLDSTSTTSTTSTSSATSDAESGSDSSTGGGCDPGHTETDWASDCPTAPSSACVAGTWTPWGSSAPENYPFRHESEHFAFYWPDERGVTLQQAQAAAEFLETTVWSTFMGAPIYFPEPDCDRTDKRKVSIHIIADGLYGGCNAGRPGIWVGPGALEDHWGLAHELTHALQCMTVGVPDCGEGGCWLHESHANFMPHQLPEYRDDVHCSEMLVNMPHLYYGSTRDRYCNWQFFEFLKDKHCYRAVNDIWAASDVPDGLRDPFNKLAYNMGWDAERLNDEFGEWAMHNVTWDYENPPPTSGGNQGPVYREAYGVVTDTSRPERSLRLTTLEPISEQWPDDRRFASPYHWAPQRWGYNVVELLPEAGVNSIQVTFRGVVQDGASSGWRWGLVATDDNLTSARYGELQGGSDGELEFCIEDEERVWLVVVATPTVIQKIVWDQPYASIHRYPYMIELERAWPRGFADGQLDPCPAGSVRHVNGGGCAPADLPASVHVGPYARVFGDGVSGDASIEDHAIVFDRATVSGGSIGGMSLVDRFSVADDARVETTFYPLGYFEADQGLSGDAHLLGDVEYRGSGLNLSMGSYSGFVDATTPSMSLTDVTIAPPYVWRP